MCSYDIDCGTDINLDGRSGSIADIITFANYFVYGFDAFTINIEGQKAATDVNHDGIPLSINDFVYFARLFTRDAISISNLYPDIFPGELIISKYSDSIVVESFFDISLGAMLFTFENVSDQYDISLDYSIAPMRFKTNLAGDTLKLLIYDIEKDAKIPAGKNRLLKISQREGVPELILTKAAGYYSERLSFVTFTILVPDQLSLSQNYPNPFNGSTKIEFELHTAGRWEIDIFNISGQKVSRLSDNDPAGLIQIFWDGTNENGQSLSSGVYFYRLNFKDQSKTKKMMLLK